MSILQVPPFGASKHPGQGAQRSPKEPKGAKRSQKEPKGAKRSQKEPKGENRSSVTNPLSVTIYEDRGHQEQGL
jgi:hypothetical protein